MNKLTKILGMISLFAADGVVAQDLWQLADHAVQVAGGHVCRSLQIATGADFNTFHKLSDGKPGCALEWGAGETPIARLELNQQFDLGMFFALNTGKMEAFVAQGQLNPWHDGEALGLGINLYARYYSLRFGASCANDLSYCNSPTLAVHSWF